jgi:hypothetical protein
MYRPFLTISFHLVTNAHIHQNHTISSKRSKSLIFLITGLGRNGFEKLFTRFVLFRESSRLVDMPFLKTRVAKLILFGHTILL